MRALLGIFVAGLLLTFTVGASAAGEITWPAQVEVLMVAIKLPDSFSLLPKLREESSTGAAVEELMKIIGNDEADVLGWPSVTVQHGTRAVSETVEEVRYPVEFDPDLTPGWRFTKVPTTEHYDWRSIFFGWNKGEITPTAFEARNIGQKLEVEASVEKHRGKVSLSLTVEDLRFVKYQKFSGVKALNGGEGELVQPEFASSKFTGFITARSDAWMLLSSFVEQKPKPRVILFLFRVTSTLGVTQKPTR